MSGGILHESGMQPLLSLTPWMLLEKSWAQTPNCISSTNNMIADNPLTKPQVLSLPQALSDWTSDEAAIFLIIQCLGLQPNEDQPLDPTMTSNPIGNTAFLILEVLCQFGAVEQQGDLYRWNASYEWDRCFASSLRSDQWGSYPPRVIGDTGNAGGWSAATKWELGSEQHFTVDLK